MSALASALRLVLARIRHRPARGAIVTLGVAAAIFGVAMTISVRATAGDLALRQAVAALPIGERTFTATYPNRLTPAELRDVDRIARRALATLSPRPVVRELLFSKLATLGRGSFLLGAIDDLPRHAQLTQGRLPRRCDASRCEVVQVLGRRAPAVDRSLHLVVVGRARLLDRSFLSGPFEPGSASAVLFGPSVAAMRGLSALELFPRTYGWVAPIDSGSLRRDTLAPLLGRVAAANETLSSRYLSLTAADRELTEAADRADAAARRLALVGGEGVALLLAFCALAALGLRRSHRSVLELLDRRGATRSVALAFTAIESLWLVAGGVAGGLVAALAASAALGRVEHVGTRALLEGARASGLVPTVLVVSAAAWIVIAIGLRCRDPRLPGRRLNALDAVIVATLASIALASSRGAASADDLGVRSDPLLSLLPILSALCGGLVAARLAPLLLGLAPARSLVGRLALSGVLRRPLRPLAAIAFLCATVALVVFAGTYRATLARGAHDQAAFAVPLDLRLTVGPSLARPIDVAPAATYAALAPGTVVSDVIRQTAEVPGTGSSADPAELVGIDAASLGTLRGFRSDFSQTSAVRIGRLLRHRGGRLLEGSPLPAGATSLVLRARYRLTAIEVRPIVQHPDGRVETPLVVRAATGRLEALLDRPATAGSRLVGFVLRQPPEQASRLQHHLGEGDSGVDELTGRVAIEAVAAEPGGAVAIEAKAYVGSTGSTVAVKAGGLAIDYGILGTSIVVRRRQPLDGVALSVLADHETARHASAGALALDLGSGERLPARVVATATAFPTLGSRFVVADATALRLALDAIHPTLGTPEELWLGADGRVDLRALRAALARAPFSALRLDSRADRQRALQDDALARAAEGLLLLISLIGLALALLGVVLMVVADRQDDEGELHALETDGLAPARLRRLLVARAACILGVGVPFGAIAGVALSGAVTRLVNVTANATEPVPPLREAGLVGTVTISLLAALAIGGLGALAVSRAAFREPLPARPEGAA